MLRNIIILLQMIMFSISIMVESRRINLKGRLAPFDIDKKEVLLYYYIVTIYIE